MRIAIVTCAWRRARLTGIVLQDYVDKFPGNPLICVKSPEDSQVIPKGWDTIDHPNQPLPQKFNAAFLRAKEHEPDAVMLVGSDGLISDQLVEYYKTHYSPEEDFILGLKDLYFYNVDTAEMLHWHGLPTGLPIGHGRIFSKKILDNLDWKPYGDLTVKRGLDTNSSHYMKSKGITGQCVTMQEAGIAADLKTNMTLNPFDEWRYNGETKSNEILFSTFDKPMRAVDEIRKERLLFPTGKKIMVKVLKSHLDGEYIGEVGAELELEGSTAYGLYRNGLISLP